MTYLIYNRLRPVLFTLGGMLLGLGYYHLMGCASGSCPLTSTPLNAMVYLGLAGWLLNLVFVKEGDDKCSI